MRMKQEEGSATIREVPTNTSLLKEMKADVYIETGKTGGKTFMISVNRDNERPTLVALHL
jgi:hypothetical protein